jgi:hypothetical protein
MEEGSGIFEVYPQILRFAGFRAKKTHTKRLQVKNVSQQPQRLSILPSNTAAFKTRYTKKGQIAPGMFEEIFVLFTPADWKYHYDCIRMVTPRGNLIVPIHAYPIMNPSTKYVPTLLDLGRVTIGESSVKKLELECTVPVLFDYEFEFVSPHPDISIRPMSGEICE